MSEKASGVKKELEKLLTFPYTMIFYEADKHNKRWLPIVILPFVMIVTRWLISSDSIARYISEAVAFTIATAMIYLLRDSTERRARGVIPGFVFYAYYPINLFIVWVLM